MKQKDYFKISGVVFALVAILHFLVFIQSWNITIDTFAFPLWGNLLLSIFTALLAFNGWQLGQKK